MTKEQNKNIISSIPETLDYGENKMTNWTWMKNGFEFVVFGGALATMVFWAEIVRSFTG